MKQRTLTLLFLSLVACLATAQEMQEGVKPKNIFNHLDFTAVAGTTGLGIDISTPVTDYARLRIGGTYLPHFHYNMTFTAQMENEYNEAGESRFEKMAGLLEDFVGQPVDNKVEMIATARMNQLRVMVDVFPFRKKTWHFTAGFYYGNARVAQCINKSKEVSSLFAINLYNRMYDNGGEITNGISLPPDILRRLIDYGRAGFPTGTYVNDVVYQEDVYDIDPEKGEPYYDVDPETGEKYPLLLHQKGDLIHAKGDTYLMGASIDNTVYANAFVNKFRPYVGIGYESTIDKKRLWKIGCNAGVMLWGGAPKLIDHSGVDLMYDVENIGGQVGDYVNLARHAKAFPVIELKIIRRLF